MMGRSSPALRTPVAAYRRAGRAATSRRAVGRYTQNPGGQTPQCETVAQPRGRATAQFKILGGDYIAVKNPRRDYIAVKKDDRSTRDEDTSFPVGIL
jgi:hypothetical protein